MSTKSTTKHEAINNAIRAAAGYWQAEPEAAAAPKYVTANAGDGAARLVPVAESTGARMNQFIRARGRSVW